jgi:hypothetical protein
MILGSNGNLLQKRARFNAHVAFFSMLVCSEYGNGARGFFSPEAAVENMLVNAPFFPCSECGGRVWERQETQACEASELAFGAALRRFDGERRLAFETPQTKPLGASGKSL